MCVQQHIPSSTQQAAPSWMLQRTMHDLPESDLCSHRRHQQTLRREAPRRDVDDQVYRRDEVVQVQQWQVADDPADVPSRAYPATSNRRQPVHQWPDELPRTHIHGHSELAMCSPMHHVRQILLVHSYPCLDSTRRCRTAARRMGMVLQMRSRSSAGPMHIHQSAANQQQLGEPWQVV